MIYTTECPAKTAPHFLSLFLFLSVSSFSYLLANSTFSLGNVVKEGWNEEIKEGRGNIRRHVQACQRRFEIHAAWVTVSEDCKEITKGNVAK